MKGSTKELACISISNQYRQQLVQRKVLNLRTDNCSFTDFLNFKVKCIIDLHHVEPANPARKSFAGFWEKQGLINYAAFASPKTHYSLDEQRRCMLAWFKILYNGTEDIFDTIIEYVKAEQLASPPVDSNSTQKRTFTESDLLRIMPTEIERFYGGYA